MEQLVKLLRQTPTSIANSSGEMNKIMENAKRTAAAERIARPVSMRYTDPYILKFQLGASRGEFDARIRDKETNIRQTYLGNEPMFSSTPLEKLKPIYMKEMTVRKRHKGRFLLCRIIAPPSRMVCISLGVEDPAGWSQLLSVYNFPGTYDAGPQELDTMFPLGTILAVREPTAKMALTGDNSHIRVDSPSDIIFLAPDDPILSKVAWSSVVNPSRIITLSPADWKVIGDRHFKASQFFAAAVAYSYSLRQDPSLTGVRLNRCLAHIRLSNFVAALHDASMVLRADNLAELDKVKALYRTAQAQYGSGEYLEAKDYYDRCLSMDADLKEAKVGIQNCLTRIQERDEGIYDWRRLFTQTKTPCTRPDVADYLGPIKVAPMQNRGGGRGVFATRDIKAGEIVVVSKAFAIAFPEEDIARGPVFSLNFLTNSTNKGTQYAALQQMVSKIAAGDHQSRQILGLYAGSNFTELESTPASDSMDQLAFIGDPMVFREDIDIGRIEAIISFNSFGSPHLSITGEPENKPKSRSQHMEKSTALYTYSSLFNHACLANTTWKIFGHVMVIRAIQNIVTGEEVTTSYCGGVSYKERADHLSKYFKECDCALCCSDRAAGSKFHNDQENIYRQLSSSSPSSIQHIKKLVKEVDSSYPPSYPQYRPLSSRLHLILADLLEKAARKTKDIGSGNRLRREAIQHEITAVEALCIRVVDKGVAEPPDSRKGEVSIPVSLAYMPYDQSEGIMACWMIVGTFLSLDAKWRAEMWLRSTILFDDMALGGGIPLFRLRYAKVLELYGPISELLLKKIEESK